MVQKIRELTYGIQDFTTLLEKGEVYVDKTSQILQLLNEESNSILLTRPRRFWKTLLISTMEQILLGNRELFNNFAIGQLNSGYDWKSSHVIRLDMSNIGAKAEIIEESLTQYIHDLSEDYNIEPRLSESGPALVRLIRKLHNSFKKIPLLVGGETRTADVPEVAVLIDEYDSPMIRNMNDPENLKAVKNVLSNFYMSLKSVAHFTRFLFVTGMTTFSQYSPFSSLNSPIDITFAQKYSTICGFTPNEILRNYIGKIFESYDELVANKILSKHSTVTDLLNSIRDWYDGYSWDGKNKVLNPLSVLAFLKWKKFGRYWYKTGGPGFLQRLQATDEDYFKVFSGKLSYTATVTDLELAQLSAISALVATGYLTLGAETDDIRTETDDIESETVRYNIAIPNTEVRMSFAEDYLIGMEYPLLSLQARKDLIKISTEFSNAFYDRDGAKAARLLQIFFSNVSHQNFEETEAFYKSHIEKALYFSRGHLTAEESKSEGDADFVLKMRGHVFVIEVKYHNLASDDENETKMTITETPNVHGAKLDDLGTTIDLTDSVNFRGKTVNLKKSKKMESGHRKSKLLARGITLAFEQIEDKGYATPYLTGTADVWAVAVSVAGKGKVAISYLQVGHREI
ncbi:MAG: AAA family ATPase [Deltaproteobacteria bacterium]|jgi:hypothetical protein|nr:AAA family ATPase [Deltaproteobacteria bacterium]